MNDSHRHVKFFFTLFVRAKMEVAKRCPFFFRQTRALFSLRGLYPNRPVCLNNWTSDCVPKKSHSHQASCLLSVTNLQKAQLSDSQGLGRLSFFLRVSSRICTRASSTDAVTRRRIVPNAQSKEYLASIGLDCDRLQKARPTVLKQDVQSLQQHVELLQNLGLDNSQIVDIIYKEASFLRKDVKSVHELIEYLKNVGMKDEEIANIFQRAPRFFSTPETVIGNIEYMKYLEVSDKNICYMLVYTPSLFFRVQGGVERVASYLKLVMTEEKFVGDQNNVIRYIMRNDPTLFVRQASELENNIKFLKNFGLHGDDLISVFRYCPSSIRIGTEFLKARLDYLQNRLSLSNEKLRDLVRRHPQLLHASVETIQSHIDLVLELGFTIEDIVKTPRIFARSTDLIRKRYEELTAVGFKPNLGSFIYPKDRHESILLKFRMRKRRLDKKANQENEGEAEDIVNSHAADVDQHGET